MRTELTMSPKELPNPLLRGRLHQVAFFVSIPAGLVLCRRRLNTEHFSPVEN